MGRIDNRTWLAIGAIAAIGLALRIAAAQGALWLDEAWSAVTAHDAGTPLGVFLGIHHDNNHHLNTLWLQLAGLDAPPWLQRGLSIAAGTAAVVVAALIGARSGRTAAICAALLFAVSPLLVTYGAEARGYAPMLLALLVAVLIVARWLDDPARPVPGVALGVTVLLGMLSQLTMAFGIVAIALWVLLAMRRRDSVLQDAVRVLAPVVVPAVAVVALVLGAAGGRLQFGNYEPFAWSAWWSGLKLMSDYALGSTVALLVAIFATDSIGERISSPGGKAVERFFILTLLIPFGVAAVQMGNSGAPRFHLIAGAGLVMTVALLLAERIASGGWRGRIAGGALAVVIAACLLADLRIVADRRADPGRAIAAMRALAPDGADIAPEHGRATAVLRAASASGHYKLAIVEGPCPATRFLFVDRDGDQPFPARPVRCGMAYRPIAEAHPRALSGTHWTLYERVR